MQINEAQVVAPQFVPNTVNTRAVGAVVSEGPSSVSQLIPKQASRDTTADTGATGNSQTQGREQKSGTDLAELISKNSESLTANLRAFFYVHNTGRVVINVVNNEEEVVRQIPPDAMIELSEYMGEIIDHLLDKVA